MRGAVGERTTEAFEPTGLKGDGTTSEDWPGRETNWNGAADDSFCTAASALGRAAVVAEIGSGIAGEDREGGMTSTGDDRLAMLLLRGGIAGKPERAAGRSALSGDGTAIERMDGDTANEAEVDVGSERAAGGGTPLDCACDAALTAAATDSRAFLRFTSSTSSFRPSF